MPFLKYSDENRIVGKTFIDNYFFHDFLPVIGENYLKIYLYGLYLLSTTEPCIDEMKIVLNVTEEDIFEAYSFFESYELVDILSKSPLQVEYRSTSNYVKPKKLNAAKFSEVSIEIQNSLAGRMVSTAEYNEYFSLIERKHFEPMAIPMIISFCVQLKGKTVGFNYIKKVINDWANRGILTCEACEQQLSSLTIHSRDINEILRALGIRSFDGDILKYYTLWNSELGFSQEVIVFAAKLIKKQKGDVEKLDTFILELYKNKKFSIKEINDYLKLKEQTKNLALAINKALGIYVKRIDTEIDNYITPWLLYGYDNETLILLAEFCYKVGKANIEGLDDLIKKLFAQGYISKTSILSYIDFKVSQEQLLKNILNILSLDRSVNQYDRQNYQIWSKNWGFSDENILTAVEVCKNMINPTLNIHKLLSYCKQNNIFDNAKIKNAKPEQPASKSSNNTTTEFAQRHYTDEQLRLIVFDDF